VSGRTNTVSTIAGPEGQAKRNLHNADEHQPLNPLSERDQINAERYNSSQRAAELWNNEIVPRI
jgi:hypothetical protein